MGSSTGRVLIIAAFLALSGADCADPAQDCITAFAVEKGYGHEGDQYAHECHDPCNPNADCGPPTVQEIQDECFGRGHPCEEAFITRDAAVCIAEAREIDPGLEGPYADLVYDELHHQRPVWDVRTLVTDGEDEQSGDMFLIDAVTGELLTESAWAEIPSGVWSD